jgi:hypothetical protein
MQEPTQKVPLRLPKTVMRLVRLGSFPECRLSFMRTLLRRMKREGWTFDRPVFDINEKGVGSREQGRYAVEFYTQVKTSYVFAGAVS